MIIEQITQNAKIDTFEDWDKFSDFITNACGMTESKAEFIWYGLQNGAFKAVRILETTILRRIQ